MSIHARRLASLQDLMRQAEIDIALIGPSADMFYLIGRRLPLTERINFLMVPRDGEARFLVPRLQAPLVEHVEPALPCAVWDESDDPLALAAALAARHRARRIAVNGHLFAAALLGLQALMPQASFRDATPLVSSLRVRKDETEIAVLSDLGKRFDAIWETFFTTGRLTGQTEIAVARQIGELATAHGFDAMSWCDVGSGPNGASPLHHGSDRVIQAGDPVVIDFAAVRGGYVMDTCRTPVAGEPSPEFVAAYDVVNRAYEQAAATIRPGVAAEAVDRAAREVIARAGHEGRFIHRLGHGLGIDAHEHPYIVAGNPTPLRAGMVFSNEPGIYIPGRWGVRTENIMLVTEEGCRSLGNASRSLVSMP